MRNKICLEQKETPTETLHYGSNSSRSGFRTIFLLLLSGTALAALVAFLVPQFGLETRAFRGQAEAQYLLGKRCFDQGTSARDYARAAGWIRKSANQGYAKAQTGLGLMYANGIGVPRNYSEALKWLRPAAEQGMGIAQNELGIMYAKGRGVPQDLNEAAKWCRQAAAQGSEIAQRNLELIEATKPNAIAELSTRTKESYQNVTFQKVESEGVTFAFQPIKGGMGFARVKMENLPGNLQALCGHAAKGKSPSKSGSAYSQLDAISSAL